MDRCHDEGFDGSEGRVVRQKATREAGMCNDCLFRNDPLAGPCALCDAPTYAMWLSEDFVGLREIWIQIAYRIACKRQQQVLFERVQLGRYPAFEVVDERPVGPCPGVTDCPAGDQCDTECVYSRVGVGR